MALSPLIRWPLFRHALVPLAEWRVGEKIAELSPLLVATDRTLDVGSGNGTLCRALRAEGYDVTPLDIGNFSFYPDVIPTLYDGAHIPFPDDSFDTALVITVLHHTPDPEQVLAEVRRVARRIIVIEEVVAGPLNRYLTYLIDSVFNLEFFGHPHTNLSDDGWQSMFRRLGLTLLSVRRAMSLLVLNRATYELIR